MRPRVVLRALALAGLALSLGACSGKWEKHEVTVGYKGEARRNPFLAGQRLLDEYGYDNGVERSIRALPEDYDTLLVAAESLYSEGRTRLFLDWARSGGHLIVALEGGTAAQNDFRDTPGEIIEQIRARPADDLALLALLDLSTNDRRKETEVTYDGLKVEFPGTTGLQLDRPRDDAVTVGDPFAAAMVALPHGAGLVTVLVDAHPLRNAFLAEHDHGDFLIALANYHDYGTFRFLLGGEISFFGLLWSRAWMALVAFALVVLVWLWKNIPRFGPFLAPLEIHSRKFSEHVDMAGRFLWRRRNTVELLAPLRRRVTHAFSRALGLHGDTPTEEVARRIAERTGMAEERVRFALTASNIRDAAVLTQTVRDLQQLHSIRP